MIWFMFCTLSQQRSWSAFGSPLPIQYSEIQAWAAVNRYWVSLNDLALLRLLDREYRVAFSNQSNRGDEDDDWSKP